MHHPYGVGHFEAGHLSEVTGAGMPATGNGTDGQRPCPRSSQGQSAGLNADGFFRSALVTGAYLEGSVSVHNPIMAQLENFRPKVFRAATEHLNFHKAAGRLFLTHPAVTLQIKARASGLRPAAIRLRGRKRFLNAIVLGLTNDGGYYRATVRPLTRRSSRAKVWEPGARSKDC